MFLKVRESSGLTQCSCRLMWLFIIKAVYVFQLAWVEDLSTPHFIVFIGTVMDFLTYFGYIYPHQYFNFTLFMCVCTHVCAYMCTCTHAYISSAHVEVGTQPCGSRVLSSGCQQTPWQKTTLGVIRFISFYNSAIAVPREVNRAGNEAEATGESLRACSSRLAPGSFSLFSYPAQDHLSRMGQPTVCTWIVNQDNVLQICLQVSLWEAFS